MSPIAVCCCMVMPVVTLSGVCWCHQWVLLPGDVRGNIVCWCHQGVCCYQVMSRGNIVCWCHQWVCCYQVMSRGNIVCWCHQWVCCYQVMSHGNIVCWCHQWVCCYQVMSRGNIVWSGHKHHHFRRHDYNAETDFEEDEFIYEIDEEMGMSS